MFRGGKYFSLIQSLLIGWINKNRELLTTFYKLVKAVEDKFCSEIKIN